MPVLVVDGQFLERLEGECIRALQYLHPNLCRLLVTPAPLVLASELPKGARFYRLRQAGGQCALAGRHRLLDCSEALEQAGETEEIEARLQRLRPTVADGPRH